MNENSSHPRVALAQALDVAKKVAAVAFVEEWDSFAVTGREVLLHAHRRPVDVARSAEGLGLALASVIRDDKRPYVEATGEVDGFRVTVWALGHVGEEAAYEAVLAPPALPREWSAQVSA